MSRLMTSFRLSPDIASFTLARPLARSSKDLLPAAPGWTCAHAAASVSTQCLTATAAEGLWYRWRPTGEVWEALLLSSVAFVAFERARSSGLSILHSSEDAVLLVGRLLLACRKGVSGDACMPGCQRTLENCKRIACSLGQGAHSALFVGFPSHLVWAGLRLARPHLLQGVRKEADMAVAVHSIVAQLGAIPAAGAC